MSQNWMEKISNEDQIASLMKTNTFTMQYGLAITEEDVRLLTLERKNSLQEKQRIEFGGGILEKLIYEFCDSDFVEQSHYVEILTRLQDIFYQYKNEMMDEITDDELLHFMREQFDTVCYGDLDYLGGTCLEIFADAIRAGYEDYKRTDGYGSFGTLDEVPRWDYNLYIKALENLND